jgi:serine/threonine protein kinase
MYRDLKPDNIGFDVRGDVKIFGKFTELLYLSLSIISHHLFIGLILVLDFGLAREFPTTLPKMANDTYQMSGKTGSLRYMVSDCCVI